MYVARRPTAIFPIRGPPKASVGEEEQPVSPQRATERTAREEGGVVSSQEPVVRREETAGLTPRRQGAKGKAFWSAAA